MILEVWGGRHGGLDELGRWVVGWGEETEAEDHAHS